jgi:SAM-dependent methyltransferase
MHPEARAWVAQHATEGRTLEIGSRDINGGVRDLFADDYTALDLIDGPGVDVVADVTTYKPKTKYDVIVCCEVLEHTDADIIAAAHRLLRPGGRLILTAAGPTRTPHSAVDGGPLRPDEFYRNVEPTDLARSLADWRDVTIDELGPDIRAVATK